MFEDIKALLENPSRLAAAIVIGSIVVAYLVEVIVVRTVVFLTRRTKTELDDRVIEIIRRPIFLTVILVGVGAATEVLSKAGPHHWSVTNETKLLVMGVLETLAVVVWGYAAIRVGQAVLTASSKRGGGKGFIQPQTVPLFEIVLKILVVAIAGYVLLVAWDIDASGWLASAGVLGIVLGFAAKDSLANLFAGLFILADAPYRLGDFVVLESGLRGRVTAIGVRSTRILTLDDIEITIPNALIGNGKIVNETAGPDKTRHRIAVSCAYGSDIDEVRRVLLDCPEASSHVCTDPTPLVRFRDFGDSGLNFELLFWIDDPSRRGEVVDALNDRVYKEFGAAKIEIPYPKRDVYIKEAPPRA